MVSLPFISFLQKWKLSETTQFRFSKCPEHICEKSFLLSILIIVCFFCVKNDYVPCLCSCYFFHSRVHSEWLFSRQYLFVPKKKRKLEFWWHATCIILHIWKTQQSALTKSWRHKLNSLTFIIILWYWTNKVIL